MRVITASLFSGRRCILAAMDETWRAKAGWNFYEKFVLAALLGVLAVIGTCALDRMKTEDAEREDRRKARETERADRLKAADTAMLEITKLRVDATNASLTTIGKEFADLDAKEHDLSLRYAAASAACRAQLHLTNIDPPELYQCITKSFKGWHFAEDRPLLVEEATALWIEPHLRHALYAFRRNVVWYRWMTSVHEPCLFQAKDQSATVECDHAASSARANVFNAYGELQKAFDDYVQRTVAESRGEDVGPYVDVPDGGYDDFAKVLSFKAHLTVVDSDAGHRIVIDPLDGAPNL
jgi:hypothetical protein